MGIKQLYNDNLRKLPNEYGEVSVMRCFIAVAHVLSLLWQLKVSIIMGKVKIGIYYYLIADL